MARLASTAPLTRPGVYLARILVFLVLVAIIAGVLYRPIVSAFLTNPALNAVIVAVLAIGVALALRQVLRLYREVRWANAVAAEDMEAAGAREPRLLAPMAGMIGDGTGLLSPTALRVLLDSIGTRLDEGREIVRYLAGLLVFLGLLGTFWGLLETIGSIGDVIRSMKTGGEGGALFEELKSGLAAPLSGMGIAFSSSLFGLSGSLVLGFLDLQVGQANNRFYTELEDWLSASTVAGATAAGGAPALAPAALSDLTAAIGELKASLGEAGAGRSATQAMANLADGIQALVRHMRSEQQLIRDWVEAQAARERRIEDLLDRLAREAERR